MLLFCKKINVEVSIYLVLTPTFIIEPQKTVQLDNELHRFYITDWLVPGLSLQLLRTDRS